MIGTNLYCSTRVLGPYSSALESIRSNGGRLASPDEAKSLLDVLVPIDRYLRGISHYVLGIDAWSMSRFLSQRHREDWPAIRDGILSITAALEGAGGGSANLRDGDVRILGYAEDALDNECATLYREMSRRCAPGTWGG